MYDEADIAALLREHPQFHRPVSVRGPRLTLREVEADDAAFVLALRLDPAKNAHLSAVPDDLARQREFLLTSRGSNKALYFIVEHEGRPVGTVRLYDQRGTSFAWGSWILTEDAPTSAAVESALAVYRIGLDLGFKAAHFEVRKENVKVWQFHERCGAERVGEDADSFLYSITKGAILALLERYGSRGTITVEW